MRKYQMKPELITMKNRFDELFEMHKDARSDADNDEMNTLFTKIKDHQRTNPYVEKTRWTRSMKECRKKLLSGFVGNKKDKKLEEQHPQVYKRVKRKLAA